MALNSGGLSGNSFENAVARAKMLAAKLAAQAPGAGGPVGGGGGQKRSYDSDEEYEPSKRMQQQNDPIGAQLAALRAESGGNGFGGGGGGSGGAGSKPTDGPHLYGLVINGQKTLDMLIPGVKVGYVIGKGGEMIRTLQERAGVKMTIFQQTSDASDVPKQLRIVGAPDKVDYAKELVNDLLTEKELEAAKVKTTKAITNEYGTVRGGSVEVAVPPQYIGLVIGKGGESIKRIQAETGTKIQFDTTKSDAKGNKICQISGPSDCVKRAEELIQEIIDNAMNYKQNRLRDGEELIRMPVPANKTGTVIGRGGETIRQLKAQSGCDIELDKNQKGGPHDDKIFIIRGPPDRISYAQQLINDKVNNSGSNDNRDENAYGASSGDYSWPASYWQQEGQSNQGAGEQNQDATAQWAAYYAQVYAQGGSGGAGAAPAAAAQQQPSAEAGGADYTKQWADYYRAYGMHKEAEMIENMGKQKGGANSLQDGHGDRSEGNGAAAPVAYPGYNYGNYGPGSSNDNHHN
ncbi:Far upstream element-binding protein 1 [Halotydeus destructor]|nr:Far upstream element-binding protein 1 [Halotydeus destructor]